ncbi:hypothetical protein BKA64DRAFT_740611 [Cadophora sp. MPI-SDFR-AT-0126]|nr:hypothetical protein BKA64DRAFT_740611 [Leotiomycetes sp. MPI-SDFR-AT-0126]
MKRFRALFSSSFGNAHRSQAKAADASSETLLADQQQSEIDESQKEEVTWTDQQRQNGNRLRIQFALWASMVISLCCILYIVLSLTDTIDIQDSFLNNKGTPKSASDMKVQKPHFPQVLAMLHSMACLITDLSHINISIILSSPAEVQALQALLSSPTAPSCTPNYLSYDTTNSAHLTYPPQLTLHNLYDILPPSIQNLTHVNDTSSLVAAYGKYKYQSVKKLAAAAYFEYDYGMWLDSEGFVLRPVEFREMVRKWASEPVMWTELETQGSPRRNEWIVGINQGCASVLGRTMESFGTAVSFWQGFTWIIEKEIVMDMVNSPSRLEPDTDFFTRLLNAKSDIFEIVMYKIHIAGRKREQSSNNSTLYTKYRVLDMQKTLINFGLEAAYKLIPPKLDIISERFPHMILASSLQDLLVQFVKEYKFFFMCFHSGYLNVIPKDVLQSFMRKAPVAMTVSNPSGLEKEVIPEGMGTWSMSYV